MNDHLSVQALTIQAGARVLVDGVSFAVEAGRIVALVGASGSGKTLTARACLGLVRARPGVVSGAVEVHSQGVRYAPYEGDKRARTSALAGLRGQILGYLPQDARASLDPLWPVARQLQEVLRLRAKRTHASAEGEQDVLHWLRAAGFDQPDRVATLFPHQLSGGMAQRVGIALALARGSRFLIADEPTTGLDPTVQQGVLGRVRALRDRGIGVLFITHDLRLVPDLADEVLVMHAGRLVDRLAAGDLGRATSEPARRLITATQRVAGGRL